MSRERIVLCRRDLADFGQEPRYCCKPITARNALDWCSSCLLRLPIWPVPIPPPSSAVVEDFKERP